MSTEQTSDKIEPSPRVSRTYGQNDRTQLGTSIATSLQDTR